MNLRARLEILEELSRGVGAAQTSEFGLLSESVELDGLRGSVGPIPRARIEELGEFVSGIGLPGPPTILSISPTLGDIDGFIPFELTGTNFIHLVSVTIGGLSATSLQVTDPQHVNGLTPALPPGVYDVVITTLSGSFTLVGVFESWDADQIVAPAVAHVYDSEEGVTLAGTLVTDWADQGAGAANLTAAGAVRPIYEAARFGDDLRHGLNYDAIDDVLTLAAAIPLTKRTIFAAFKWNATGAGTTAELVSGTSGSIYDFALDASGGITTMRTYDANVPANRRSPDDPELNSGAITAFGIGGGSAKIIGQTYDGVAGELRFYLNNTQQGAAVPTTAVAVNWKSLGFGVGNAGPGLQGALVLVEDIVTASDRGKLVTWLWGKWLARSTSFSRANANTAWVARDGTPMMQVTPGGPIILPFGWNGSAPPPFGGGTSRVTNEVWSTPDEGLTFNLILAEDLTADPAVRPSARHTAGTVVHISSEGTFAYIIGSDIYNGPGSNPITAGGIGTSDVYRTPDGITYERMTNTAPWGPLVLHMVASYLGALWVFGGQTNGLDSTSATQKVWKSVDDGRTWQQQPDMALSARGLINSGQGLPILNGKLYFMGGGVSDTNALLNTYLNDVWSFDGTNYALVAAAADWSGRQYNGTVASDGKLWAINGVDAIGNIGDVWSSATGLAGSWRQQVFVPWRTSHADGIVVLPDKILIGPGNGAVGQPAAPGTGYVYRIERLGYAP